MSDTEFDGYGFLKDPNAWNRALAQHLAQQEGVAVLGDEHWRLLQALRQHFFATGGVPVMRHLCRDTGLAQHCVSDLFDNPGRAWRIAGLPDPGEEARAYLETADVPG